MPTGNGSLFAPAARAGAEEIARSRRLLQEQHFSLELLDCMPQLLMVLDEHRQVILVNRALVEYLEAQGVEVQLGSRPGELLGCIHSHEQEAGCGTTEACRHCGAVLAVLQAQKGHQAMRECRLLVSRPDGIQAEDLQVAASPLPVDGQRYVLVTVTDLSHEKRRRALERVFFHDLMNTASVVNGYASLLRDGEVDDAQKGLERIAEAAQKMLAEIRSQRDLMAAEEGTLEVHRDSLDPCTILGQVVSLYAASPLAKGVSLEVQPRVTMARLVSDGALLGRVLGNMVKNAVEATPIGGRVQVGCSGSAEGVTFWVRNEAVMARSVQLQVFQRSFSTKATNRGLGTYSMKLLGENYLGGRVSFTSAEGEGTTFRFFVPWQPQKTESTSASSRSSSSGEGEGTLSTTSSTLCST